MPLSAADAGVGDLLLLLLLALLALDRVGEKTAGEGLSSDVDIARGMGLRGLPQAMLSFSQKRTSPSEFP